MIYALNQNQEKIKATPKALGSCPACVKKLIPKTGSINIWHWSHKAHNTCDSWYERESAWHLGWKSLTDPENCEVTIKKNGIFHIADIKKNEFVIELQNSPISPEEIVKRSIFYQKIIWLFNATQYQHNIDFRKQDNYYSFRWFSPRKSQSWCLRSNLSALFWDMGKNLFQVKKIYPKVPCGGWGIFISKDEFIKKYL